MRDFPQKQGLYSPQNEHDACGIGVVVNIQGTGSHGIIKQAISVLINLNHRGGNGSEKNSGDGAGILTQIPHEFFKSELEKQNVFLPNPQEYAVGVLFSDLRQKDNMYAHKTIEKFICENNQSLICTRVVPVNSDMLGNKAFKSMPQILQFFIKKNENIKTNIEFERKLYIIRKQIENFAYTENINIYIPSLSSNTICYKGMLTADQVGDFFVDLKDPMYSSAIALVHSRYSTNTFPSWERAHPYRYLIHNGEINTLQGNVNWMATREYVIKNTIWGEDLEKLHPIINQDGSDSSMFDNCLEFLTLSGRPISHAMMMMIPEAWSKHESMSDDVKAFYEYHSCLMEPWDGPSAMAFTDGRIVGAILDRNGLRPSRYYLTHDNMLILASEVGVIEIPPEKILAKERLHPGRMLLIDTHKGQIINDSDLKEEYSKEYPYREWLNSNMLELKNIPFDTQNVKEHDLNDILKRQIAFGYTAEDLRFVILPMANDASEAIGSMGIDTPIAVLSQKPQLLFNYFKQQFAQVTNPPIDAIREEIVISTETYLGTEGDILQTIPENSRQIKLLTPIINNEDLARITHLDIMGFKSKTFPILFNPNISSDSLNLTLESLFINVDEAIDMGVNIIILSDRGIDSDKTPIPSMLAVSGLHHHLILKGTRTRVGIILESGEPRETHHFACLIGYGVSAINPYLAIDSIVDMINDGVIKKDVQTAIDNYLKACLKGVIKIISKMGISTIQSYQGAQIFEAIGIGEGVIAKYFKGTTSRIDGLNINDIQKETTMRHSMAFGESDIGTLSLESSGNYQWRKDGEYHLYNPLTIHKLQTSVRNNDYNLFCEYSRLIDSESGKNCTLRGLMDFRYHQNPVPIETVESVDSICQRFKSGAMSFGSISQEAHETIAIAMNRIGAKSNSGEGGESFERYQELSNGDSKNSAIKQIASARFGVTSSYLINAKELQIKMAQGAKPGEGGQLPGKKVYPWIAKVRHSTPGVGLISPPPHHDIYSIEDLSQLICDLKNANRFARINVKLVSESGVGTVAAGVAKGLADVVLISGYDGGTGASPQTSIKHAGLPWEIGLAEANQTLILNDLRSRITLEVDGKLMTGRDVAIACLLGAEEFGFATTVLVALGCVMMRVCSLDTCPVGIATQSPELRKNFRGKPEHVINFMHFIAMELREIMSKLGFKTIDEMVGRSDYLTTRDLSNHWKTKSIDLSKIFYQPKIETGVGRYCQYKQKHNIENTLDMTELIKICTPAIVNKTKINASFLIKNVDRVVGTMLGSEITCQLGADGLPDDSIILNFKGAAGQSFGAFIPKGLTLLLEGDSNDFVGKGLSGGKIAVYPDSRVTFIPSENIITGNVAFYGATSGQGYICGVAGERFCVRNSGANVVVEGVGDHCCEYMTNGRVVVLGKTGRNFSAGMSGGIAYVLDEGNNFAKKCNLEMVTLLPIVTSEDMYELRMMIENHVKYTNSARGKNILSSFEEYIKKFVKVLPNDYSAVLSLENEINKTKNFTEESHG